MPVSVRHVLQGCNIFNSLDVRKIKPAAINMRAGESDCSFPCYDTIQSARRLQSFGGTCYLPVPLRIKIILP
jgi:dissimilatory sulfite reductase (desulfoviridin) alpha/beta subunit